MKMPCEKCITLSMCKSLINPNNFQKSVSKLYKKCSLYRKFVSREQRYIEIDFYAFRLEHAHNVFEFLKGRR